MNTKRGLRVIYPIGLLVLFLVLNACGKPQGGGPQQGGAPEVAVVTVQSEPVAITTELPGRTAPYVIAEVRPQVGGIIQKRLFTEGSDVKAGEVLYQIDPAPYQAAYDNAKAGLTRAEANLPAVR
jgi:membrane fusion protein (multidrug efflux system)